MALMKVLNENGEWELVKTEPIEHVHAEYAKNDHSHNWSDLGENSTGNDTLEWDGNIDELEGYFVNRDEDSGKEPHYLYHISNIIPSVAATQYGGTITTSDGNVAEWFISGEESGMIFIETTLDIVIAIYPEPFVIDDVTYPAGTYAYYSDDVYVSEFMINSYTGFPSVNKMPDKYLPKHSHDEYALVEHSHSWDEVGVIGGDTLSWDGNTDGLYSITGDGHTLYRVSDVILTMDDLANGVTFGGSRSGEVMNSTLPAEAVPSAIIRASDTLYMLPDGFTGYTAFAFCQEDQICDGSEWKTGIYFVVSDTISITSLTVPGYTGFPSLSKIPVERLPDGIATETYVDAAVAGIVNSAPETLDTLNELAAALGDDPNFATTIATQIGLKLDASKIVIHNSTTSLPAVTNGAILIAYDA